MAKRFTDTNKYRELFFRNLPSSYKLFWDYLQHECDHAGVWIVDVQIAQICLGKDAKINLSDAIEVFNKEDKKIIVVENGKKWFIPSFVRFQYGSLNPSNKAHNSVLKILKAIKINPKTLDIENKRIKDNLLESEKAYSDIPSDTLINVDKLSHIYLSDHKLLKAVSEVSKKAIEDIKNLMPDFLKNLKTQGKNSETAFEFAKYFKNWLKYQDSPSENKKENVLNWKLLTNDEIYNLDYKDQVALIIKRTNNQ